MSLSIFKGLFPLLICYVFTTQTLRLYTVALCFLPSGLVVILHSCHISTPLLYLSDVFALRNCHKICQLWKNKQKQWKRKILRRFSCFFLFCLFLFWSKSSHALPYKLNLISFLRNRKALDIQSYTSDKFSLLVKNINIYFYRGSVLSCCCILQH